MSEDWSAQHYLRFEDERTRPAIDLLNAVPSSAPRLVLDLGCGPGNSTELLVRRFPSAEVRGLDSSPDMLRAARERLPGLKFEEADIASWQPAERFDLVFANAVLQWIGDHDRLLPCLVDALAPGGSLAVQMPDNLSEPSHAIMREVAAEEPWRDLLASAAAARTPLRSASQFYDLLWRPGLRVDIWRTTYYHPLTDVPAICDWLRSTGLRPFLAPLNGAMRDDYLERYRKRLAGAYPPLADGKVLLAFPRLFIVATRT
jgi:trans-aconitate 2-methyltransferase